MKITRKQLKRIIKEELNDSVPVPRTWLRHAAAQVRRSSYHVSEEQAQRLSAIAEELIHIAETIE